MLNRNLPRRSFTRNVFDLFGCMDRGPLDPAFLERHLASHSSAEGTIMCVCLRCFAGNDVFAGEL